MQKNDHIRVRKRQRCPRSLPVPFLRMAARSPRLQGRSYPCRSCSKSGFVQIERKKMFTKILKYLCGKDHYKMAAIIICLNFLFELVFKYRFVSKIEVFYFIIAVIICIGTIKKMIRMRNGRYLPAFYDLWPAMIMIISCISLFRLSLLPFVISSFMILLLGKIGRAHV